MVKKTLFLLSLIGFIFLQACSDEDASPESTITVSDFTGNIAENPTNGTSIGTVTASTTQGTLSFSIISQTPSNAVAINANSGELTVADASLFDFETNQSITGVISVTNGTQTEQLNFTINITNDNSTRTIWQGTTTTFTKGDNADPTLESNQDRLTDKVWLTRGTASSRSNQGNIFNAVTETSGNRTTSPAGTEWAEGSLDNIDNLTFEPFTDAVGGRARNAVNKNLVLHLIEDDIYLSVKFTSWSDRAGGFAYERSTP